MCVRRFSCDISFFSSSSSSESLYNTGFERLSINVSDSSSEKTERDGLGEGEDEPEVRDAEGLHLRRILGERDPGGGKAVSKSSKSQ